MTPMTPTAARVVTRPWADAALVALLFVGLQGLGSLLTVIVFSSSPDDGSFIWEIIRSGWGIYASYLALVVGAGWLLRTSRTPGDWSAVVWRAVVLFLPALVVVTFVLALATGLIQDQPFQFLGIQILS